MNHAKNLVSILAATKVRNPREIILKEKPEVLIEIGAYIGYSAVSFADAMRNARPEEQFKVFSLELNSKLSQTVKDDVRLGGREQHVEVMKGDARECLAKIAEPLGPGVC